MWPKRKWLRPRRLLVSQAAFRSRKAPLIVQNYEADISDGRHQATRVFESAKTVAQNYQLYLDFLTEDGWEAQNKSQAETVASLYAVKTGSELTVSITKNAVTGAVTVDLSALVKK